MKTIRETLAESIASTASRLFPEAGTVRVGLAPPKNRAYGDYASNIALTLSKTVGRPPMEVAQAIVEDLPDDLFASKEAAPPGFINVRVSPRLFRSILSSMADGSYFVPRPRGVKVIVEFVSANPTGPLNVVSARAAAVGDSLCRILRQAGYETSAEYYVNDAGNQVRLLGESVLIRLRQLAGETDAVLSDEHYQGEYLIPLAQDLLPRKAELDAMDEDTRVREASAFAVERLLASHRRDLEDYRVTFDSWARESALHASGKVREVFKRLRATGKVYEQDGKQWFRSTDYGDEKDRVLLREDGTPTYLMPDIAYHWTKVERGFDLLIDLWGPDHHGYIARLSGGLQALGVPKERLEIRIVQQVNLLENGEKVRMSKRTGKIIQMRELLEEVGVDAARYFLLARTTNAHLDFDLDLARRRSDENPVFYIQYASARIHSIFRQAAERGVGLNPAWPDALPPLSETEESLVRTLCLFGEEVAAAAEHREPNILARYLLTLAGEFHRFYNTSPVLNEPEAGLRNRRALIVAACREVFTRGLGLLGITAPERMSRDEEP